MQSFLNTIFLTRIRVRVTSPKQTSTRQENGRVSAVWFMYERTCSNSSLLIGSRTFVLRINRHPLGGATKAEGSHNSNRSVLHHVAAIRLRNPSLWRPMDSFARTDGRTAFGKGGRDASRNPVRGGQEEPPRKGSPAQAEPPYAYHACILLISLS
jgi:hypothetical protein